MKADFTTKCLRPRDNSSWPRSTARAWATRPVRVHNQSLNRQKHEMGARGQTDSYSEQPRPLLLPQEVRRAYLSTSKLDFCPGNRKQSPHENLARQESFTSKRTVFKARAEDDPSARCRLETQPKSTRSPCRCAPSKPRWPVADTKPMQAEQRQRWNPKDTASKPAPGRSGQGSAARGRAGSRACAG
ncbi:hypothetical protein PCPL58_p3091 (plasmid) [Pseudomonas cerasi]|nr:hypothetical protein PCPL58_p3091 [Pseudomonas cerasi]